MMTVLPTNRRRPRTSWPWRSRVRRVREAEIDVGEDAEDADDDGRHMHRQAAADDRLAGGVDGGRHEGEVPTISGMKPELRALKSSGSGPTEAPPPSSAWQRPRKISMPASVTMKLGIR